jgi:hypothetical protein
LDNGSFFVTGSLNGDTNSGTSGLKLKAITSHEIITDGVFLRDEKSRNANTSRRDQIHSLPQNACKRPEDKKTIPSCCWRDVGSIRKGTGLPPIIQNLLQIHGANFSFIMNEQEMRCARRTALLAEFEGFYNYQIVLERHREGQ